MTTRANMRTNGLSRIKSIQAYRALEDGLTVVFSALLPDGAMDTITFLPNEYGSLASYQRDLAEWRSRLPGATHIGWSAKEGSKVVEEYRVTQERWA